MSDINISKIVATAHRIFELSKCLYNAIHVRRTSIYFCNVCNSLKLLTPLNTVIRDALYVGIVVRQINIHFTSFRLLGIIGLKRRRSTAMKLLYS